MAANNLDTAIPLHLRKERTTTPVLSPNFVPPYPSYASLFPTSIEQIVMAILGVQYHSKKISYPTPEIAMLTSFLAGGSDATHPSFWEPASMTDELGCYNIAIIAYWPSFALYQEWREESGFAKWWDGLVAVPEAHGWFLEVLSPTVDRWETINSTMDIKDGGSTMRDGLSEAVKEHGYWGSTRDRLPIAQVDGLHGEKIVNDAKRDEGTTKEKKRVSGKKNLCVIRSGQDWSSTAPDERQLYLESMHPVLIKGMDFLRDHGAEIGCYSCRFMDIIDVETGAGGKKRTFGLAYFDELASLEKWSKYHKTHLDIFGGFLKYAKRLGENMTLKLWHEVLVLEPGQQTFEYVGCHAKTGMLGVI
ncbi:phenylacetaldoxime dehydratase [Massariosphaeria phaeospora]|uniref:Phenylacetaldoxime dehydratase n=1 Tax=Massariosphaeria phaeospora TaxID=100035 RepID=A0A7C8I0U4_9PLEO|nr:phenylacetaldoxime dehydratase [Massariosphaeria phaeospora]